MQRTSIAISLATSLLVILGGIGASAAFVWHLLPHNLAVASGVRIHGLPTPTTRSPHAASPMAEPPGARIDRLAAQTLQRTVRLRVENGPETSLSLEALGVRVDQNATLQRAMAVGRRGSLAHRVADCWKARNSGVSVPLAWSIDAAPIVQRVALLKEDHDEPSVAARYDFKTRSAVGSRNGRSLDAYGALVALYQAVRSGADVVDVPSIDAPPTVSAAFLDNLDMSQTVGHYETRFGYLGGQQDRAHNIHTAASRLDGLVMMPGQVVSFNQVVGHRTLRNGFRKAWEIFKGEMVQGVGGGTCQAASTLYAAAFLGGFDVVDRSPHSRPSGYIELGLDATVVDGLVDLKLRNPYSFPVVLRSTVDKGVVTFDILGARRPAHTTYRGDVVSTQRFKRKLVETSGLGEGRVVRKQRGILGYTVRKTRWINSSDGFQRHEVTRDVYPPTAEILLVPPGTDPERDLPPLASHPESPPNAGNEPCVEPCEQQPKLRIDDAPHARSSSPQPSLRVVIDR